MKKIKDKTHISVTEFHHILEVDKPKNTILVDVRTPEEFAESHIKGAVNIPLDVLEEHAGELKKYDIVFVNCRSGGRSGRGCELLRKMDLSAVVNIDGGIIHWSESGFDLQKHQPCRFSLIQQSMMTGGSLVLLGTILSVLVAEPFVYLAMFVGCGLIFAGYTGNCPMARILAKMPWNK